MTTTVSANEEVIPELDERCRALERECEELRERVAQLENPPPKPRRRIRTIIADGLFVLLAGVVVAATAGAIAIATGIWKLNPSETQASPPATVPADAASPPAATAPATSAAPDAQTEDGPFAGGSVTESATTEAATTAGSTVAAAAAAPVHLEARAVGGECWIQIRRGGATGEVLLEEIMPDGGSVTLDGKRFWVRVGNPTNLQLFVNGTRAEDLPSLAADLIVTKDGVRISSTG